MIISDHNKQYKVKKVSFIYTYHLERDHALVVIWSFASVWLYMDLPAQRLLVVCAEQKGPPDKIKNHIHFIMPHQIKPNTLKWNTRRIAWKQMKCWGLFIKLVQNNVVVIFLPHVIFVFLLFLGMVVYANEVETKEQQKLPEIIN